MAIKVRLFNRMNEDAQSISTQIAQLQQTLLDIERKATMQIQNIEKQKQQKIDTIKMKIIKLQSDLTASTGVFANNNVATQTDTSQQNQNAGVSVSK